ncbi:penicillin-binding protein [Marinomonas algicola]|uniref:penicillin-binding protein n=1 Tax=Marinomonas algicola TaxID=2773454 RepID=UPI00174C9E96|nr:penicillin-binding protein [Marinomonas algicola]
MIEEDKKATLEALKIAFTYMPKAIEVNKYDYGDRYQWVLKHVETVREALLINGIDPDEVDGEINSDISPNSTY